MCTFFLNREMAWFDYCYRHHLQLEGPIYIIANNKLCCRTEWFFKAFTPFNRETKLSNAHLILFVFSWSVVFWGSSFLPLTYIKLNRKLNGFMLNQNKSFHRFCCALWRWIVFRFEEWIRVITLFWVSLRSRNRY